MKKIHAFLIASLIVMGSSFPVFTQGPGAKPASTRQTLKLENEEIVIIRDEFGVPHILSSTERGGYYGGGYAVAEDRLYQLERFRRDARGQLAEIEGGLALGRDQQARLAGYPENDLRAMFESASEETKQAFQAYADGINLFMKEAAEKKKLPEEFARVGINEPAPWTVLDSVSIAVMMAQRFGSNGGSETLKLRVMKWLKEKYGNRAEQMFDDLYWINDPKAPTTIPDERAVSNDTKTPDRKASSQIRNSYRALEAEKLSADALEAADEIAEMRALYDYNASHSLPTKWGSYGWVVAPQRSVNGNAILVGGPQMGFSTPPISHEIHYSAGKLNVIGMGFAGVPAVLVGHNDRVTWTATSGLSDIVDIFAEKLNPENKFQYMYKGQYRDMEKRIEVFKIKGGEAKEAPFYRTIHGPVVLWDEKAGVAFSRATSYRGHELDDLEAIYGLNRAANIKDVARMAEKMYTNLNFLAATVDGDIGYWHCGKVPIRPRGLDPRLPTPGTGEYEWTGFLPFSEMPQVINPKQGYLINWNNKPAARWNNGDQAEWGEISDIDLIEKLIKARPKLTYEQVRDIAQQISAQDTPGYYFTPYIISAIEETGAAARDPNIREALGYFRAWDCQDRDDSVPTQLGRFAIFFLREEIFSDEFKDLNNIGLHLGAQSFDRIVHMSLVLRALDPQKAGIRLSMDYLNGRKRNELVLDALKKSLDVQLGHDGPQMNLWANMKMGQISFSPLPGIPFSVRGTYLQAIEASKPVLRASSILAPGQSGDRNSPHYSDQRELAGYWLYKPLIDRRNVLEASAPAPK